MGVGKVLLHFTMSVDGYVAGPGHSMAWMAGTTGRPGLIERYVGATGAVLGGRAGWDAGVASGGWRPYGGAWAGPVFVLTHRLEDLVATPHVTFLSCDVAEAARIGLEAAAGKNLEVHSPTIGRQLLHLGLVDQIDLHIAPVLLGDGVRLFDSPGAPPIRLARLDVDDPAAALDLSFSPGGRSPTVRARASL